MMLRIKFLLIFLLGGFSLAAQTDAKEGKKMFNMNCVACHRVDKKLIGPALSESIKLRSEDWIVSFVKDNTALRKKGDKDAIATFKKYNSIPMPAYPQLSEVNILNILAYVKEKTKKSN
jgi:mono/diheme cytochrome c family protein